jgi:hypothetical protein
MKTFKEYLAEYKGSGDIPVDPNFGITPKDPGSDARYQPEKDISQKSSRAQKVKSTPVQGKVENSRFRISDKLVDKLEKSGVGVAQDVEKAGALSAAKIGAKAGAGLLKTVLPGVGLVIGTQDAISRAKRGDWVGAGIAGLSAVLSLGGPITAGASLGLDAYNLYRDYSKEDEKPAAEPGKSSPAATPVNAQPAKGNATPDPEILTIQKKILAKDPNALPKHGADGLMGPETQAAMTKYIMSTESQQTVAEGIRSLQERMELIEAKSLIRESLEQTYFLDKNYFMYDKSGEQVVDLLTISVINEAHAQGQIKIKKLN